jgi:hypothetical protein
MLIAKLLRIFENERDRAIGMLHDFLNVHLSTISRFLSRFQVTWQFSDNQRHRRPWKTTVRHNGFIVKTSRRKRFISAPKDANEIH